MKKNIITFIALFWFSLAATWAQEAPTVTRRFDFHQREFERKIGYDAALQQHVGAEVVQLDWRKVGRCAGLRH